MASTDKVISRKDGNVGYVIFNNPERRNAMSLEMWEACTALMTEYAKDDSIRVVVLAGAGTPPPPVVPWRMQHGHGRWAQVPTWHATGFRMTFWDF